MRITLILCLLLSACGGGISNQSIPPAPAAKQQSTGPVVFMGDSITEFWEKGPFVVPSPKLSELEPGSINVGVPGNLTADMLARFQADVLSRHPSVVVILGGTNDIRQIEAPTIDNINAMAEQASAAGARVVICLIPPQSVSLYPTSMDQATTDAHVATWNQQLRTLAASYGYTVVDYHSVLVTADGSQNQSLFVETDLIHPNANGYNAMWPVLKSALVSLGEQL